MKQLFSGVAMDAPVIGTGGLVLMGINVEWWIAGLALIYGVVRLIFVCWEFYWKWKDRNDKENSKRGNDGGRAHADRSLPDRTAPAKDD